MRKGIGNNDGVSRGRGRDNAPEAMAPTTEAAMALGRA